MGVCQLLWAPQAYLSGAFRKILADDRLNAAVALGIRSAKAGRRRGARTHDDTALAAAYWLLRRHGLTAGAATAAAAGAAPADRRTVQRAVQRWPDFGERRFDDRLLRTFLTPSFAAKIGAILAAD